MKLKPQPKPRPTRRATGGRAARGPNRRGAARPGNRMARRPGVPLRSRLAGRLPSLGRVLAGLGAAAGVAGLVALAGGPWLRVDDVGWDGGRFTPPAAVADVLDAERGRPVLAVDTAAARARLVALPSVADAQVTASLTGVVTASITEPVPAIVWETRRSRLVVDAAGTLFAVLDRDAEVPQALAAVPYVTDDRFEARLFAVGDRLPASLLRTALALASVDPVALGSTGGDFGLRLDDDFGFVLRSSSPEWEAAFGVFGLDPRETAAAADARLERQVTAMRTLFASRDEDEIGWVDVRNPGKVYFRAKG
jgi:cell division protein FtsQ